MLLSYYEYCCCTDHIVIYTTIIAVQQQNTGGVIVFTYYTYVNVVFGSLVFYLIMGTETSVMCLLRLLSSSMVCTSIPVSWTLYIDNNNVVDNTNKNPPPPFLPKMCVHAYICYCCCCIAKIRGNFSVVALFVSSYRCDYSSTALDKNPRWWHSLKMKNDDHCCTALDKTASLLGFVAS